jgi:hypothetical protein
MALESDKKRIEAQKKVNRLTRDLMASGMGENDVNQVLANAKAAG